MYKNLPNLYLDSESILVIVRQLASLFKPSLSVPVFPPLTLLSPIGPWGLVFCGLFFPSGWFGVSGIAACHELPVTVLFMMAPIFKQPGRTGVGR